MAIAVDRLQRLNLQLADRAIAIVDAAGDRGSRRQKQLDVPHLLACRELEADPEASGGALTVFARHISAASHGDQAVLARIHVVEDKASILRGRGRVRYLVEIRGLVVPAGRRRDALRALRTDTKQLHSRARQRLPGAGMDHGACYGGRRLWRGWRLRQHSDDCQLRDGHGDSTRHLLEPLSVRMRQVPGFRICLSAAAKRPPREDSPRFDSRVSGRFEAKLHCSPGSVMRHIIPGRGFPPRCVATPSHMSNIVGRRALRSGRRAPGLMQRVTLPGD